jgi:hypothetical protein
MVAITGRSSNLFRATSRPLTQRAGPAQRLAPITAGQAKPAKISFSFNGRTQKILSIKETIFSGFASLLTQRRAASHPQFRFTGQSRRAKIHFPQTPFSFCPPAWAPPEIFLAGLKKTGGRGLENFAIYIITLSLSKMCYNVNSRMDKIFLHFILIFCYNNK